MGHELSTPPPPNAPRQPNMPRSFLPPGWLLSTLQLSNISIVNLARRCGWRSEPARPSWDALVLYSFISFTSNYMRTLLHSQKSQLFCFQAIPHSLPKTPGVGVPSDQLPYDRSLLAARHRVKSGKQKGRKEGTSRSSRDLFQVLPGLVCGHFVDGLAGLGVGLLRLGTSFSGISRLALSFCSFSDCGVARASAFFIWPNSEDCIM